MTRRAALSAIRQRDARFDGSFVYAVKTTGVYCRPSCASRQPRAENVIVFNSAAQAAHAGYRPCKRCQGDSAGQEAVLRAKRLLEEHGAVALPTLARRAGLSPFHLQRVFKQHFGVSPSEYAKLMRERSLRKNLRAQASVTRALVEAGYSSSGRAHEDARLGMTASAYRNGGTAERISYCVFKERIGHVLIAVSVRGLCYVTLGNDAFILQQELAREYPKAERILDARGLKRWITLVRNSIKGAHVSADLPLDLAGSLFQRRVWQALRRIAPGQTRTYSQIAEEIGLPKAVRAVASACAANRLAVVVPCHRVLRRDGTLAGYRWGQQRKRRLLEMERVAERQSAGHGTRSDRTIPLAKNGGAKTKRKRR